MRSRFIASLAALTLSSLAACSPPPSPGDAGDAAPDAVTAPDAPDAAAGDAAVDAPPLDPTVCLGRATEDLAAIGTLEDVTVSYSGDNASAPEGLEMAVQPPASCRFRSVYQRVFRYTMRATAALRVSTNNPGSDASFDSTIFVFRAPCDPAPASVLGCNDDDPLAPPTPHVTLSLVTTPVLPAGITVLIAVGGFYPAFGSGQEPNPSGEVGSFELTVGEIEPVADGESCDPSGRNNVCVAGSTCVADSIAGDAYRCRAEGASAGAACLADGVCTAPLQCDTQYNRCYGTVPAGAECGLTPAANARCAAGATCVSPVRGAAAGACVAAGTAPLAACAKGLTCAGAGLACRQTGEMEGVCLRAEPAGAACNTLTSFCPAGQSCVGLSPGATAGACTPTGTVPGSACRATAPECDEPLFCISGGGERSCRTVGRAPGDPCGPRGACAFEDECVAFEPSEPYRGVCVRAGTQGGTCREEGLACDAGLACTNPTNRTRGRCVQDVAAGAACDLGGRRTRCAAGNSCVREGGAGAAGFCRADGTVAGAACRGSGARCDAPLACSASSGAGVCQAELPGGACEPRFAATRCPAGQVCRATSLEAGACAAASGESEPNHEPATAAALGVPAAVRGALARYDVDCVAFDVPAAGSVFASAVSPDGRCANNLALDLYRVDGAAAATVGSDADSGPAGCPLIDGADGDFPWARGLAAGRYAVCVREASDRRVVPGYVLSVNAR